MTKIRFYTSKCLTPSFATGSLNAATIIRIFADRTLYFLEWEWSDSFIPFVTETSGNASLEHVCVSGVARRNASGCIHTEGATQRC